TQPVLSYTGINGKLVLETTKYPALVCTLGGDYQVKNAATVLKAVELLKEQRYNIPDAAVYEGFANVAELTGLLGRWQVLQDAPKVICDTGHNTAGIRYVVGQLEKERFSRLHIVFGMVNDKDISGVLSLLPPSANYYFTQANIARALAASDLQMQAAAFALKGQTFLSVRDALAAAYAQAAPDDLIYIGGSNFIVAEALAETKRS
ncbi:MAG: bifunctional folylpolyglutamate synthase/dihydrofolate synthase, partial [Prevotella sp.]|nr:bifunctional folylpolyglutamate synthase/dihydrofolate synthase [Prevotella sp.]